MLRYWYNTRQGTGKKGNEDMEALKAAKVWRRYGAQEVLKGLDLVLEAGAFEALMGPSGCGKSTFLHIASGLIAADGGTVEIGGAYAGRSRSGLAARVAPRACGKAA